MTDRVTSFHVAALAGVSQPTVSRALRNHADVSADTRTRIQEAAHQLGYRLDRRAASLRGGSTRRIAVVILSVEGGRTAVPNPFYMALLTHVSAAATRRGYDILVSFQKDTGSFYAGYQQAGEADGIIVIGSAQNAIGWRFFADARGAGAHVVGWGNPADTLPTVRCDNQAGAGLVVGHLLSQGCRHVAFLGPGWRRHRAYRERRLGYVQAMEGAGLRPIEAPAVAPGAREDVGFASAMALMDRGVEADAIFAASDLLAIGAVRALLKRERRIPQDVAIAGFDGIGATSHMYPALTTIEQDAAAAGEELVTALLGMVAGIESPPSRIPVRLVIRESS